MKGDRLRLIYLAKVEEGLAPLNIHMGSSVQHSSNHCRNVKPKMRNNLETNKTTKEKP